MKRILIVSTIVSFVLAVTVITLNVMPFVSGYIETPDYQSYQIDAIDIKQNNFNSYDLEIAFNAVDDLSDVTLYISQMAQNLSSDTEVSFSVSSNLLIVDDFSIEDRGDYFVTLTFGPNNQSRAVLPITFPIMQPKIYLNDGLNNIMFEVDGTTSWSSFIDPEGVSIYKSATPVFDDEAFLIEEDMRITVTEYLDHDTSDDYPYYYIRFSSKEGRVTYTSSALFGETTQADFQAHYVTSIDGENYLRLRGSIHGPQADNDQAARDISLRVGNYPVTFMVDNSYQGDDSKRFDFYIELERLSEGSNDLVFFYTENGTMLEASVATQGWNLETMERKIGASIYSLSNPDALVIHRNYDITYQDLQGSFEVIEGRVHLIIEGSAYFEDADLIEYMTLEVSTLPIVRLDDIENGTFRFLIDLTSLAVDGTWYDIHLLIREDGVNYRVDLPANQVAKIPFIYEGVHYELPDWENALKVAKNDI